MPDPILGMDAKMYFGAAAAELGALTELTNVKDARLNGSKGEADVTTRANQGWRGTLGTLKDGGVSFETVWLPGDAGFDAILEDWLNGGGVEIAFLDQGRDVSGAQGLKGLFSVTEFEWSQPLEEAQGVSVTIKLTTFREWVEVA